MADAGFFKGTSAEQDSRFANKQKKLLKQMKFPDNIDVKIDMLKVNLDVIKPWITKRLQELLGIEDDVVIEFVFNQLEDKNPDPKMMQINLTGFLGGSKARLFIGELWKFLASAQSSPDGIPAELVEMKKKELLKRQEEDDRLREIRKREEDSHRQETKPDIEKLNGRNQMSASSNKSRNENGNTTVGYKSRAFHEDNRRRSPEQNRRVRNDPEPKARRSEKKSARSVSKSSDSEDARHHRQEKPKHSRHRLPSKSPSHSRSPVKSSRKTEKPQQRSSSTSSTASNAIENPPNRSSSSSSVDRSHKKINNLSDKKVNKPVTTKIKTVPVKETVSKKNKKPSKRTRSSSSSSSSASRSSSNSSVSSHEVESKKNKKPKRSPSPNRNRKSEKKKDDHKSRKHSSKSSSRKHHRSNDNKGKSHRDHPDKSKTKRSHRNESSKKKSSKSSDHEILQSTSPKKPRLESQIKVQTPPPSDDHKAEPQVVPIKPNRTERIVVLEESRSDRIGSISTRVSIKTPKEEHPKTNSSSEDENEIDLRERLLREKAIKSMKSRQLSTNSATHDRIVYETQ